MIMLGQQAESNTVAGSPVTTYTEGAWQPELTIPGSAWGEGSALPGLLCGSSDHSPSYQWKQVQGPAPLLPSISTWPLMTTVTCFYAGCPL